MQLVHIPGSQQMDARGRVVAAAVQSPHQGCHGDTLIENCSKCLLSADGTLAYQRESGAVRAFPPTHGKVSIRQNSVPLFEGFALLVTSEKLWYCSQVYN